MNCESCRYVILRPFKTKIPAGESTFQVSIPQNFLDHDFYVSDLEIVPSYYSFQASLMKLDEDPEFVAPLAESINYKVRYNAKFSDIRDFTSNHTEVEEYVKAFNEHLANLMPSYNNTTPAFIDWVVVDDEGNIPSTTMNYFIRQQPERFYQNVDEDVIFNVLPQAARQVPGSNNYAFPDNLDNVRLRLWISPGYAVVFRSEELLAALGFQGQFKAVKLQYTLSNATRPRYTNNISRHTPAKHFAGSKKKISVVPVNFDSPEEYILVSQLTLSKPDILADEINEALLLLSRKTNFALKLNHLRDFDKYKFDFPSSRQISVSIQLPKRVAAALGYDDDVITSTSKSNAVRINDVKFDLDKKAATLCMDTGLAIVTQKNYASYNLVGCSDHHLGTLKAHRDGKLALEGGQRTCTPKIELGALDSSSLPGHRIVQFQVLQFDDGCKMEPLNWPCSCYVQGQLVGYRCSCQQQK